MLHICCDDIQRVISIFMEVVLYNCILWYLWTYCYMFCFLYRRDHLILNKVVLYCYNFNAIFVVINYKFRNGNCLKQILFTRWVWSAIQPPDLPNKLWGPVLQIWKRALIQCWYGAVIILRWIIARISPHSPLFEDVMGPFCVCVFWGIFLPIDLPE